MEATLCQSLADSWKSPIIARVQVETFTGGVISEKYLANLDSQGLGPAGRFRIGRKVVYPTNEFVKWLAARSAAIPERVCKTANA